MALNTATVEQLSQILNKAVSELKIQRAEIPVGQISHAGGSIMGDVYNATIKNEDTSENIKVVIKKAPSEEGYRQLCLIEPTYKNEIHFYSKAHKMMKNLEQQKKVTKSSVLTPDFIVSETQAGNEMILLKDLAEENYVVRSKTDVMDENHVRAVFKAFGHFHGISFVLKDQNQKQFDELVKPFVNIWKVNAEDSQFVQKYQDLMRASINEALKDPKHANIKQKLEPYVTNFSAKFSHSINYTKNNGCILHGDAWANSLMFKYNDQDKTKIDSVRLLDFQTARYGSPVQDLSYFLFVGAPDLKQNFDNWESLLDVYYIAFSETVNHLGKKAEDLLPRKILSDDWKTYAISSMLLSMLLLKLKYASPEEIQKQRNTLKNEPDTLKDAKLVYINYDQELFNKRFVNIVEHLSKINAL